MRRNACLILLMALVGCGGGAAEGPKTFPVTGTLKVGGNAVPDINVQLVATGGGLPSSGKTDKDGKFTLTASNGKPGATAGKYKLVLAKAQSADTAQYTTSGGGGPPKAGDLPFPKEYATVTDSPKEVEVVDKPVVLDLDLK